MLNAFAAITFPDLFGRFYTRHDEVIKNPNYRVPHQKCEFANPDLAYCGHCGIKNEIITYPAKIASTYWQRDASIFDSEDAAVTHFIKWLYKKNSREVNYNGEKLQFHFDYHQYLWFLRDNQKICTNCAKSVGKAIYTMKQCQDCDVYVWCFEPIEEPNIDQFKNAIAVMEKMQKIGLLVQYMSLRVFGISNCECYDGY
jgi:hypothetical protein